MLLLNARLRKKRSQIQFEAEVEGERIKKGKLLKAKEKFLQLKADHERSINQREQQTLEALANARKKERKRAKQLEQVQRKDQKVSALKKDLQIQLGALDRKLSEVEAQHLEQVAQLEALSGTSAAEAKAQLIQTLQDEARSEAMALVKQIKDEATFNAKQEAKKIIVQSMQRLAAEQAVENAVAVFNIDSDELKGRIIGREGRNIRTLEAATGVEVLVDDTPGSILLSCFDPVRREVARLALQELVTDGRIHPSRIEEVVRKTNDNLEEEIAETGKRTCMELEIHGLDPELIRMVGRMKFRSSYAQNLLQHSREVANLSATMASELGLDPKLAKRAGLLHDIGKVPDDEAELPHALLGMKLAERYGEHAEVCNAIGAHHDEIEMTCLLAPVVQICDAISGARPGARRHAADDHIKRLKDLEALAMGYRGVTKSYAVQAGRELRVLVESDQVSDKQADNLSFDISQKIQRELTYPGHIRVTVIREKRSVSIAR